MALPRSLDALRRLKPSEWSALLTALIALPVVSLGVRGLGYRRVRRLLAALTARTPEPPPDAGPQAERLAVLVRSAARRGPHRAKCLAESLVLWGLLRRRGIESEIRIGVKKERREFAAHAWVEHEGRPLNDGSDVRGRFAAFPSAGSEA